MPAEITSEVIDSFREQLENHPVYQAVSTIEELRSFMEHHVYSVWDFMSLIKYLQAVVAPANFPWTPQGDAQVRRFINELVLEEESDETVAAGQYSSHFELYQTAMKEIGADFMPSAAFVDAVEKEGVVKALELPSVPAPSRIFTSTTFRFIHGDKPHEVAAALALGREHIIPGVFRSILQRSGVTENEAPTFHYYLRRHIHLDEDFHAPLSLRLLNRLCSGDDVRVEEAIGAARAAVKARLQFWDGVLHAIESAESRAYCTAGQSSA